MDAFDRAYDLLIINEGGYVNDKDDAGGETKYGISKARFPDLDISKLTLEGAKEITRKEYWDKYRCGELPWPFAICLFDGVFNHNPANPVKWLQQSVGVSADGVLGPRTVAACNACRDVKEAVGGMLMARLDYYAQLGNYEKYKNGWRKRLFKIAMGAGAWQ